MQQLTNNKITTLINQIRTKISEGQLRSKNAKNLEQTKSYWSVGESLYKTLNEVEEDSSYGKNIFNQISEAINIPKRTLYLMFQFYSEYQDLTLTEESLCWTFYRILLTIPDLNYRKQLEDRVVNENLTSRQLQQIIKLEKDNKEYDQTLHENIGPLYHYRIIENKKTKELYIDCGFKTYKRIKNDELKKNDIIEITNKETLDYKLSDLNKRNLYTYKATLNKVIDGDTFWLDIDLGFETIITRKVRLRGVNTPELLTEAGQNAKNYVTRKFQRIKQLYVKSYHRDLYDRYLVDIYLEKNTNTYNIKSYSDLVFLNKEIIVKKTWIALFELNSFI